MFNVLFHSVKYSHVYVIVLLSLLFTSIINLLLSSVASHGLDHKGKKWEEVLGDWLSLFRLFQNPKAFYQSQVLRDVLQYRLVRPVFDIVKSIMNFLGFVNCLYFDDCLLLFP